MYESKTFQIDSESGIKQEFVGSGMNKGLPTSNNKREQELNVSSSPQVPVKNVFNNSGRWNEREHKFFVKQLCLVGKDWKKIAVKLRTRSAVQVRTHAQKFFLKLRNAYTRNNKYLTGEEVEILNEYVLNIRPPKAEPVQKSLKRRSTVDYSEVYPRKRSFLHRHDNNFNAVKVEEPDILDFYARNLADTKMGCIFDALLPRINSDSYFGKSTNPIGQSNVFIHDPCRGDLVDKLLDDDFMEILCDL